MRVTSTFNLPQSILESFKKFGLTSLFVMIGVLQGFAKSGGFDTYATLAIVAIFIIFSAVFIGVSVYIKHRNYLQIYYELDDEKVIYFDGFFAPVRKEILYRRILEVDFRQGFFQKKFGLGTVTLVTNSASSNQASAGITMKDIANPHEVYEAVKAIVYPHIKNS